MACFLIGKVKFEVHSSFKLTFHFLLALSLCVRGGVCPRSRGFWGGGEVMAHHPALHFFGPATNNKTGRGRVVGSI